MKASASVAAFVIAAASAAGVAALPNPYQGADTLFDVTRAAITAIPNASAGFYIGGGSGNAAAAMSFARPTQMAGPMSRMLESEANVCVAPKNASGIVIGLDAIDIFSSVTTGAALPCQGSSDNSGFGLAYSGTPPVFASGNGAQTWKWVLALLYGGLDSSSGIVDCNQSGRAALVANWSNLFQTTCANGNAACASAPISNQLWHAFRPDDNSGTSDTFASLLGIFPRPSISAVNGFGSSPYCNAMNWDTSAANANCASGPTLQFTGPGGIPVPGGDGVHRKPPPGTWGDNPLQPGATGGATWDVLPTQMQDNDPIRRPCLGGATNVPARPGEEVCNLDGALGLVLPMVDDDFIPITNLGVQYPTNPCTSFVAGNPNNVFNCATRGAGTRRSAECANGDSLIAGLCNYPIDSVNNTAQCVATKSTVSTVIERFPALTNPDGRAYNLQLLNISTRQPLSYVPYPIPSLTGTPNATVSFAGAYNRIHQVETVLGTGAAGCRLLSMTDQIACLAQADPCSVGLDANGGKGFASNPEDVNLASGTPGAIDAVRVSQVYPGTTAVQLLGQAGEYKLARKLYFNSSFGFNLVETPEPICADGSAAGGRTCALAAATVGTACGVAAACTSASTCSAPGGNATCGFKGAVVGTLCGSISACKSLNVCSTPGGNATCDSLATFGTPCGTGACLTVGSGGGTCSDGSTGGACSAAGAVAGTACDPGNACTTVGTGGSGGTCSDGSSAGGKTCSLLGSVAGTTCGPSATCGGDTDEWALAQFEATPTKINPVLIGQNEFTLGNEFLGNDGGTGPDPQFCEDFNEQTICNVSPNMNACVSNPPGFLGSPGNVQGGPGSNPGGLAHVGAFQNGGTSTVCGNGIREAYEECDNGVSGIKVLLCQTNLVDTNIPCTVNGDCPAGDTCGPAFTTTAGNGLGSGLFPCSLTCRCVNDFVNGFCN